MTKKTLKEYSYELEVWENWLNSYRKFVPQFIDEAKTKSSWQEWDKAIFNEFFERSNDQCVSSLRQGYFTKEEQEKIKSNWNQIAPLLKTIAENQENPDWNAYQEIKKRIRQYTTQDRKAATNRLVASLQPNLISTIVSEGDLGDLINKINTYTTSNISLEGDWFKRSYNVCKLFQQELEPENPMDIITYPWQLLEHLRKINSSLIGKQKEMESIIKLVQTNKNLILTGAPGTGKTYKTAEIAVALIDGSNKLPSKRVDLMKRYKELINAKQIAFTTFHQSLDYEEFIEGLKPTSESGNVTYNIEDGIFKDICDRAKDSIAVEDISQFTINGFKDYLSKLDIKTEKARNDYFRFVNALLGKEIIPTKKCKIEDIPKYDSLDKIIDDKENIEQFDKDFRFNNWFISSVNHLVRFKNSYSSKTTTENKKKNFILIIDEINRGNISKIFGELITLLEKDKRIGEENEITVTLPYSQETFGVPSNLFIIGTMNTADRSIGHIDYAIRRRFSFVSLKSDKNVISSYDKYDNGVKEKAESLFDEIKDLISANINTDLDTDDLMIGHSYFLCKDADDLKMRLECEIIPLIEEYEKDGIIMLDRSVMKTKFEEWKALWS